MSATDRPAVVLLHSSASSGRQWTALAEVLRPRFDVHAVDLHGHGAQPAWGGSAPLSLADDAALVGALLREHGSAHVVAHSYGAAVALEFATRQPQSVLSLVAYEPVLFHWLVGADPGSVAAWDVVTIAETISTWLASGEPRAAARCFVEFWSGAGAWAALPTGAQNAIAGRMPTVQTHFDALLRQRLGRAELTRLTLPMLFMTGARTVAATRRIGALLRAALPRAEHATLAGMGHMGPVTHAVEVNRQVVSFLLTQTPARRIPQPGAPVMAG